MVERDALVHTIQTMPSLYQKHGIVAHDLVCSRLLVEIKHTDKFKDHKDVICTERSCITRGIGQ